MIFRTNTVPERAISSLDVPNALELWQGLEATCVDDCDFLTIPHNSNKAWGLTYSRFTWDGKNTPKPIGACANSANRWWKYSKLRGHRNVPLVSARPMKNALSRKCLNHVSPGKPRVARSQQALCGRVEGRASP